MLSCPSQGQIQAHPTRRFPQNNQRKTLFAATAHMLQGWLQSRPLRFFPHMSPQLWGISLRCHSGFVTLPANQNVEQKEFQLTVNRFNIHDMYLSLTTEAGVGGRLFQCNILAGRTTPTFG